MEDLNPNSLYGKKRRYRIARPQGAAHFAKFTYIIMTCAGMIICMDCGPKLQ